MKTKTIFVLALFIMLSGVLLFAKNQKQSDFSDIALANIEAIASGEETHGQAKCYSSYDPEKAGVTLRCVTCDYVDGRETGGEGTCKW